MPFLIDGNNVMTQSGDSNMTLSNVRRRLIQEIAAFIALRRVKVTVVFDGVPDDQFPEGIIFKGVRVMYAKPGSDADTRIKGIINKASYRRDLTVVSSDKEVVSYAKAKGAQTMTSGEFRTLLRQAGTSGREKPPDNEPVDVDDWLRYFNDEDAAHKS
jgi:predicted RNA-binding protein with PIN domain